VFNKLQKTSRIFTLHQTTTKEHVFKYHLMVKIETKAILKRRQKKLFSYTQIKSHQKFEF
jgi:hypothetical protein